MAWSDRDIFVTASNPYPGRIHVLENSFGGKTGSRSDEGLGYNVYIAGGTGRSGSVPVTIDSVVSVVSTPAPVVSHSLTAISPTTSSFLFLSSSTSRVGFSIFNNSDHEIYLGTGPVTTESFVTRLSPGTLYESQQFRYTGAIYGVWADRANGAAMVSEWFGDNSGSSSGSGGSGSSAQDVNVLNFPVTQSVFVVNQSSGSSTVTVSNLPATQSVYVVNQPGVPTDVNIVSPLPVGVSGNVGVVGTASVYLEGTSGPLDVSGTVSVTNFPTPPAVQEVSGTVQVGNFPVVQTVTGSVTVQGISLSGATPPEAIPNSLDNIVYTRKAQKFDLASDLVNYIGYAVLGASPASASWAIKRLSFDVSGNLESQDWSSPTGTWNNRTSEVYS